MTALAQLRELGACLPMSMETRAQFYRLVQQAQAEREEAERKHAEEYRKMYERLTNKTL